jgi:hypothetical protein
MFLHDQLTVTLLESASAATRFGCHCGANRTEDRLLTVVASQEASMAG